MRALSSVTKLYFFPVRNGDRAQWCQEAVYQALCCA